MEETKLKPGDRIRVVGFVMLKGLDEGEYIIGAVKQVGRETYYTFRTPRGRRVGTMHATATVDYLLGRREGDLNGIDKL